MANEALIAVENVSFRYGETAILQDVSFGIVSGDFLALTGPNGSGKTTLIRIILGLLKPSRGTVSLLGQEIDQFREWNRIGYVPQKATNVDPFFPASVREIVAMGLLSQKPFPRFLKAADETRIDRALQQVGMESL